MRRFFVLLAVLTVACTSGTPQPSSTAVETGRVSYTGRAGDTPVGVIPAGTLHDPQRNKDIQLSIDYPTRGGPNPVIIFSHGFGASARAYVSISSYWASHGYVVIRPVHADAGKLQNVREAAETWSNQTAEDWRNRVRDVTFVIDSLSTLEQQYPELQGKMDKSVVGVDGHSYGAFTALLIAGATTSVGGGPPVSYADHRVKAALAMSPQGVSSTRGLTRDSFNSILIPTLFMIGSEDKGVGEGEDAAWRKQAFDLAPAGDKWFVEIAGANHFSFVDRVFDSALIPPPSRENNRDRTVSEAERRRVQERGAAVFERQRNIINIIRSTSLAFWDTYLKSDTKGRDYLSRLKDRSDVKAESK